MSMQLPRTSRHARIKSLPINLLERASTSASSPRRRTAMACERCRIVKIRCDASWPQCSNCKQVDVDCKKSYYTHGSAKQYIESLERRCIDLEQCLDALVSRPAGMTASESTSTNKAKTAEGPASKPSLSLATQTEVLSDLCVTLMLLPHFPLPDVSSPAWTWDDSMMTSVFPKNGPVSTSETDPQAHTDTESMPHSTIELFSHLDVTGTNQSN